jgi:hypothetical protein
MPQWQAFSEQSAAGAPHAAENAFAACVYHARIRQLDPNAAFPTPAQSQTDQLFANLPRRDGGAGANMIAQSLDPAARAERQRLQQQADAERQARQQQAAANNAAFWDTLLGVVATVGNAYVDYESQRAQIEAGNQAAAAQAAANAALQQHQQQSSTVQQAQGGVSYTYINGQCVGYGCPQQSANAAGGQQSYLNPTTGQACITVVGQDRDPDGDFRIHFQNTCERSFLMGAVVIGGPASNRSDHNAPAHINGAQGGVPARASTSCGPHSQTPCTGGFTGQFFPTPG